MPEAAVDVALVGPDEEPDGYGRLELQTAHRLCPNTWVSKYRLENIFVPPNVSALSHHVLYMPLATMNSRLATMYLLLATIICS